jgi:hypothetical protein
MTLVFCAFSCAYPDARKGLPSEAISALEAQGHNAQCFVLGPEDTEWKGWTVLLLKRCPNEYPVAWSENALRWPTDHELWTSVQRELLEKAHQVAIRETKLPTALDEVWSEAREVNGRIVFDLLPLDVAIESKLKAAAAPLIDDSVFFVHVVCERSGACKVGFPGAW